MEVPVLDITPTARNRFTASDAACCKKV